MPPWRGTRRCSTAGTRSMLKDACSSSQGIHGRYFPGDGGRIGRRYYRCAGNTPLTTGRARKCPGAGSTLRPWSRCCCTGSLGAASAATKFSALFRGPSRSDEVAGPGAYRGARPSNSGIPMLPREYPPVSSVYGRCCREVAIAGSERVS